MDLKEKLEKLEQKKKLLQKSEQLLKLQERKKRNNKIFILGGLCEKFRITFEDFSEEIITGALKELSVLLEDEKFLDKFKKLGTKIMSSEKTTKVPVIVIFENKIEKDLAGELRSFGLRWNRFREEWNGTIELTDELKSIIKSNKGKIEIFKRKEK